MYKTSKSKHRKVSYRNKARTLSTHLTVLLLVVLLRLGELSVDVHGPAKGHGGHAKPQSIPSVDVGKFVLSCTML